MNSAASLASQRAAASAAGVLAGAGAPTARGAATPAGSPRGAATPAGSPRGAGPRAGAAPRTQLRLVPLAGSRAPRAPFAVLLVVLLTGGLLVLLLLNTALAQGAFTLGRLQAQATRLSDQVQALGQQVRAESAPAALAARARALGMVPGVDPAFVRVGTGLVSGDSALAGRRIHLLALLPGGLAVGPAALAASTRPGTTQPSAVPTATAGATPSPRTTPAAGATPSPRTTPAAGATPSPRATPTPGGSPTPRRTSPASTAASPTSPSSGASGATTGSGSGGGARG